jgi:hypothetical protein
LTRQIRWMLPILPQVSCTRPLTHEPSRINRVPWSSQTTRNSGCSHACRPLVQPLLNVAITGWMRGQGSQCSIPSSEGSADPIRSASDAGLSYENDLGSCQGPEGPEEHGQSSGNQGCSFTVTPYGIIWQEGLGGDTPVRKPCAGAAIEQ